ncbi:MAG: hypothetical protein KH135_01370, partial [Firmicutes bacterium]|nr:hypothetical protein [Bacillota bacterium]
MVEKKNTDYFLVIIITFACLLLIGVSIFFQNENQKFHGKAEKITKNVNNAQNNSASKQEQKMDEIEKENQKIEAIAVDEVIKENQATIKTEEDVINYVTK